ncbi:MAG: citryl-CoA lyase [Ilumatobacteraceae bacterium]|nr:citryl-CoA lyase [Ilumatobacteraceae bacterium]
MSAPARAMRSMLFTPADRPERATRVATTRPDCVVLDLEDGVGIADKESARDCLGGYVRALADAGRPATVLVRVNGIGTDWFVDDMAAVAAVAVDGVVVPKVERVEDAGAVRAVLGGQGLIIAGIESAAGVASCEATLGDGFDGCYFGAEDFITDMGGVRTAVGNEVLYARSRVALAARLAQIPALDQIVPSYRDDELFLADGRAGRQIGFSGKLCIHPAQVALAHEVYRPSADEVARARRIVEAFDANSQRGIVSLDGEMLDAPMLARARDLLARDVD